MPASEPRWQRPLAWLRRHKLAQVLAIYAAASWAILEVTDVFIDKLGLPPWFFPAAVVLLLIGFAVVTTTALVEHGSPARPADEQRRQPLPREILAGRLPTLTWPRAILGGVLAFAALALVGVVLVANRGESEAPAVVDPSVAAVAVLPFRTTGSSLEVWREGLMDVLAANLDGVGDLRAIDTRTLLSRWRSRVGDREAPTEQAIGIARELGARWAVHGQAVELGGRVRLDTKFYSAETGEEIASSSVTGVPDSILELTEGVTIELLRGLGRQAGLGDRARAFTSTSLEAVKAFLEGEQAMRRSEWEVASEAFERALAVDSTFAMAAAHLSLAYGWRYSAGHPDAIAAANRAFRYADDLPERERALLELNHRLENGRVQTIDLARRLTARYPDDPEIWYLLGEATYHFGPLASIPLSERTQPFERALTLDSTFTAALIHPVENAAMQGDLEAFDRFAFLYLERDSTSNEAEALRVVRDLLRGTPSDSLAALEALGQLNHRELRGIALVFLNPANHDLLTRVSEELVAPRHPTEDRGRGFYFWTNLFEVWQGRVADAQAALEAAARLVSSDPDLPLFQLANIVHGYGDPALAPRTIRRGRELGLFDRPDGRWVLATWQLRNGELENVAAHADTLSLVADSLAAAGDSLGSEHARGLADGLRGMLANRRGDHRTAAETLRRSIPRLSGLASATIVVLDQKLTLAETLVEFGEEAEALRILEGSFDAQAYWDAPAALARAQLYEKRGEREPAIRAYSRVVELWRYCDADLRPQWEAANRALSRLLGEA